MSEKASHALFRNLYKIEAFRNMRESRARMLYGLIKPQLESGNSVLEIGTGKGDLFRTLKVEHPGKIISLDIEDQRIYRGPAAPGGIPDNFVLGDGSALPFADKSVDASIICFVLHHIPKPLIKHVIRESLRISKHVMILEDYIGDEIRTPADRAYREYIRGMDALLNFGVPGGAMRNQKPTSEWRELIDQCGGEVIASKLFSSKALNVIPLKHVIFDVVSKQSSPVQKP